MRGRQRGGVRRFGTIVRFRDREGSVGALRSRQGWGSEVSLRASVAGEIAGDGAVVVLERGGAAVRDSEQIVVQLRAQSSANGSTAVGAEESRL